jgi:hypothetical protein
VDQIASPFLLGMEGCIEVSNNNEVWGHVRVLQGEERVPEVDFFVRVVWHIHIDH